MASKTVDTSQLEHCYLGTDGDTEINDTSTHYYFYIYCDNGYAFTDTTPIFHYLNRYGSVNGYFTFDNVNERWVFDLPIYENPEYFFERFNNTDYPYVTGIATKITPVIETFPFINLYSPSKNDMTTLSQKRFYLYDQNRYEDLGQYILAIINYPFSIETSESKDVYFGFYNTNVSVPTVDNYIYELSLGKIEINGIYKNTSDILNSVIEIHLPYADIYKLDSKYINTEIEVIYKINIMSNGCIIEIYSDDLLVDTIECSIGYDVPYTLKEDKIKSFNINFNTQTVLLKNREPKIIVHQKAKIQNTKNKTLIHSNLINIFGYIRSENIILVNNKQLTQNEIELIKRNLSNGIIIRNTN